MSNYTNGMFFRDLEQVLALERVSNTKYDDVAGIEGVSKYFEMNLDSILKNAHNVPSGVKITSLSSEVGYMGITDAEADDPLGVIEYLRSLGSHTIKPVIEKNEKEIKNLLKKYNIDANKNESDKMKRQDTWFKRNVFSSSPTKEYESEKLHIDNTYKALLESNQLELTHLFKGVFLDMNSVINDIRVEITYAPNNGLLADKVPLGRITTKLSANLPSSKSLSGEPGIYNIVKHPLIEGIIKHPSCVDISLDNVVLRGRGSQFKIRVLKGTEVQEKTLESLTGLEFYKDIASRSKL